MRCSVAKWLTNAGHDAAPPTPISISARVISSCFHLKKRENSQKAMVSTCFTVEPPRCPKLGACESTVNRAGAGWWSAGPAREWWFRRSAVAMRGLIALAPTVRTLRWRWSRWRRSGGRYFLSRDFLGPYVLECDLKRGLAH